MFGGDPYANIRKMVTAPVQLMRTYQIAQPLQTHYREAGCAEVACPAHAAGWRMGYDLTDPERRAAARWIRDTSGRSYTYELLEGGTKIIFTFPAGQQCFKKHRVPLEREPFYVVRAGDFRGNPDGQRIRHRADTFIDAWENDLDKLNTRREQG